MVEWISKISTFLNLDSKYIIPFIIGTSILLFFPNTLIADFGLSVFKDEYLNFIGGTWVVSLSVLSSRVLLVIGTFIHSKIRQQVFAKKLKLRLLDLTPEEKKLLKRYIDNNTRTQSLFITDGNVLELEGNKIIKRVSDISSIGFKYPYNIQPLAFNFLRKNPNLLD